MSENSPVPRAPKKRVPLALTSSQAATLGKLWQDHSGPVLAMLVRWCGQGSRASDILQEVFRRLASTPQRLSGIDTPRAFLMVTARRIAIDFARREEAESRRLEEAAGGESGEPLFQPVLTDERLREVIQQAFQALPPEQLRVIDAKLLKGQTLEEIARKEGISLNTAASRFRYALNKIRAELRPYYDDINSALSSK